MAAATDERLIYEILSAVGEIPEGNVATYGQIARLIGRPKNARLVGRPCENLLPALRESLAKCEKSGAGRVFPPKVPIFAKNALKDVLM